MFEEFLEHYGILRKSGRYPWGSGDDPYQSAINFKKQVDDLKRAGMSDVEIANKLELSTTQLRNGISISSAEIRANNINTAQKLKDKGYSNVAIGKKMNINESTVRSLLDPAKKERMEITKVTSNMLKNEINKKEYIDVGSGVENHLGITRTKLNTSIAQLEAEGYKVHYIKVEQVGNPGKYTTVKVLTKDDKTYSEVYNNRDLIKLPTEYSIDKGRSYLDLEPIKSISSDKVYIKYSEEGGSDKDGVIEMRRGNPNLDLGNSRYAQVRIGVDNTHFLKGMAMYSDDIPEGYDIVFNTNKTKNTLKMDSLKKMKDDVDNPFGATISRQNGYLNIVNEEGSWGSWSKTLSSQMLSKQRSELIKQQLDLTFKIKQEEYNDIMSLTNQIIKQKLLMSFADGLDSSAVDLKAAGLPRTAAHVILPFPSMKDTEIYAPNYKNGEKVVLIRHPHGGIFEIPELVVNNKNPQAKKSLGNAKDAVGISPKTASILSGADFDGDSVLVIPNNNRYIKTHPALKSLKDFDPRASYPGYDGMPKMSAKTKGTKMGDISNLITDMTIKGANFDEISRAVKHSMVVIDAEKHNLNYKQSYIDNGIPALKNKYQGKTNAGASTLISKSSSEARVGLRKQFIDPNTGKKVYKYTDETYIDKKGNTVLKTTKSTKMYETEDAHTLSSGTRTETIYASYSNKLKNMANAARKESINIKANSISISAKKVYAKEIESLKSKLNIAIKNKPLERQAQILANKTVANKKKNNPNMDADSLKKTKSQALIGARNIVGAKKQQIDITDNEWRAIQENAISSSLLKQILDNTNETRIKQLSMPRLEKGMSDTKIARATAMVKQGYTQSEIADFLGVSPSTISNILE